MTGNLNLMSALRKVWAEESNYWLGQLKAAGLAQVKDVGKMVEYASRAESAEKSESVIVQALKG